jgi:hypothetical protein
MTSHLWNQGNGDWDWALGSPSNLSGPFYPNASAQL